MKTSVLLSLLCLLLFVYACKKDRNEKEELEEISNTPQNPNNEGNKMQDLNVPDGFNYSYAQDVELNFKFYSKERDQPVNNVRYTIYGMDAEGHSEVLFNGGTGSGDKMELQLEVPNHFEKLIIKTTYGNTIRQFEFLPSELISKELPVEGLAGLESAAADRASDCYPSMVNTFTPDNKGFTITSDELINTIEIQFSDGTTETVTVNASSFSY